jgi:outer membrane protein OmpA-like peptidoglycan-associated protein
MMLTRILRIQNRQNWRVASLVGLGLWACGLFSSALAQSGPGGYSRIQPFGQTFVLPEGVVDQQTRMIFYRTRQSSTVSGAASIYVNGAYHAFLVPGGYAELCLPTDSVELGLKTVEVGRNVKVDLDTITVARAEGGQNQYFRVKEVGRNRQVLLPVAAQEALAELPGTREQVHTVSRVPGARDCMIYRRPPTAPPNYADSALPAAAVVPQSITLAADALFAFGRSDLYAMSPSGRTSLDAFVMRLRGEYTKLDRLHVIGHADPIGQPMSNERLSVERAQTVRDYLMQTGLNNVQITSEGRGSREPAVTQCGWGASPEAIGCHAPNRRVVIEIIGARR